MRENEAAAHALVAELAAAGVSAQVTGAGVNWQVHVTAVAARSALVHCFWYERTISGLMLGMNPSNARAGLGGPRRAPYEGPEYLVELLQDGAKAANGRSRVSTPVVAGVRAWLAGVDREALVADAPFIDEKPRAMRALAARIDPSLRREIGDDPAHELWIYGDGRSCRVQLNETSMSCAFFFGQAQVAVAAELEDAPSAVAAWLVERPSVSELPARVPGVEIERHAEHIESDPARWHWLHVADRLADPDDVLGPLHDLIAALAASPVATQFYSYSSLNRLCFSASSHYPWVDEGLPLVEPARDGTFVVDGTPCDLAAAVKRVEATLAAAPVRPFFGSAPHHELKEVSARLKQEDSSLHAELEQQHAWYRVVVRDRSGQRR